MSFSCATGRMRRSTNSRTVSWIERCSSFRSRSTVLLEAPLSAGILTRVLRAAGHARLGRVHGAVGCPEERTWIVAVPGADRHSEARRQLLVAGGEGRRHRLGHAVDRGPGLVFAGLGQDARELVAADAEGRVGGAKRALKHASHDLERL